MSRAPLKVVHVRAALAAGVAAAALAACSDAPVQPSGSATPAVTASVTATDP